MNSFKIFKFWNFYCIRSRFFFCFWTKELLYIFFFVLCCNHNNNNYYIYRYNICRVEYNLLLYKNIHMNREVKKKVTYLFAYYFLRNLKLYIIINNKKKMEGYDTNLKWAKKKIALTLKICAIYVILCVCVCIN